MKKRVKAKAKTSAARPAVPIAAVDYGRLVAEVSGLLEQARRTAARAVNSVLTAAYWEVGRRIVEHEQGGKGRAGYGEELLARLSQDLTEKHGRGFSERNLEQMRAFYLNWEIVQTPSGQFEARAKCPTVSSKLGARVIFPTVSGEFEAETKIRQTVSAESEDKISQTASAESAQHPVSLKVMFSSDIALTAIFPLSWSQYVRLLSVEKPQARAFYESEAIRGGWSVRQLDHQISTQFYERAMRSKRPDALLARSQVPQPQDLVSAEEEIRNPYLLEFLDLKDEYSETDLEEALIRHLEAFLLELGTGFTFVARQKRIRVGNSWYRMDLLLYHRVLRCLVVIDLKTGAFTHADAGQMNLYLNYVKDHLTMPDEVEPVGIILCSDQDEAVVKYATGGIRTRVFASKYLTSLPTEETLRQEIVMTQRAIRARWKEEKSGLETN